MTIPAGFLMYVTLYRLSVLAIGALAIYLGYKLFTSTPVGASESRASAAVVGGGFKLTMTNFWPGTYFALFGTVLICIMLWQGSPQLLLKEIQESKVAGKSSTTVTRTLEMRGSEPDIDAQWEALSKPGLTLPDAALPMANIARVWQQEKRIGEAVAMARMAAKFSTENQADHLALFAGLLLANGEQDKALQVMQVAADQDSAYSAELTKMKQGIDSSTN